MTNKPFSIRSAVNNDFTLTLAILVPFFIWVFFFLSSILVGRSQIIFILAIAVTILSPGLLVWRLRSLRAYFKAGEEVVGKITHAYFFSDRGRLQFKYTFEGVSYSGSAAVHKNDRTTAFKEGQDILLIVDRARPKRAFMLDLYT